MKALRPSLFLIGASWELLTNHLIARRTAIKCRSNKPSMLCRLNQKVRAGIAMPRSIISDAFATGHALKIIVTTKLYSMEQRSKQVDALFSTSQADLMLTCESHLTSSYIEPHRLIIWPRAARHAASHSPALPDKTHKEFTTNKKCFKNIIC